MARASSRTSEAKFSIKVEKKRRFTLYHLQIQLKNVLTLYLLSITHVHGRVMENIMVCHCSLVMWFNKPQL